MLHINFIKSQLEIARKKEDDIKFKYNNGSLAMKRYLYPQFLKVGKQIAKWEAKLKAGDYRE